MRAQERLAAAFSEGLTAAGGSAATEGNQEDVEQRLAAAHARGCAAFPEIELGDEAFARHLGRACAGAGTSGASLPELAFEDLYLAAACAAGASGAAAVLRARHEQVVRATIIRIVKSAADAADVEQQLLHGLLVGSVDGPPKIVTYAGQAPIGRWLQVAAQRAALMWLRGGEAETRARDGAAAEMIAAHTPPEVAFLKQRYRHDFEEALTQALSRLTDRERVLLRLHLVDGVAVDRIGKMFSVSQSTASRWMASAREALLDDVKKTLHTRLPADSSELASLAGLVASGLDMSLSQLLRTRS